MTHYDNKNFSGVTLLDKDDLSGLTIEGACFSQEIPDTKVFPDDMRGTTFVDCNLNNCLIPEGNTVIRGSHLRFKVQEDGYDWVIDENNNPIERL